MERLTKKAIRTTRKTRELLQHLAVVHPQGAAVDVDEHRREAVWSTDAMSETQVRGGTMISPGPDVRAGRRNVIWLADEPELTKTLYFTPSQDDHSASKARTWADCVRIGSSSDRKRMTASRSSRVMLFFISGQSRVWPTSGIRSGSRHGGSSLGEGYRVGSERTFELEDLRRLDVVGGQDRSGPLTRE